MKKKLLATLLISTLAISICACGNTNNNSTTSDSESVKQEEAKKEPLDLTGTWKSENNEGSWMEAEIKDSVITINWVSDNGETKSIYWIGTYEAPEEYTEEYKWTSVRDQEQTDMALLASTDDTKEFTYSDNEITYEVSAMGTTQKMHLTKGE